MTKTGTRTTSNRSASHRDDPAKTLTAPRLTPGTVVRIWRLPPLSGLDDSQERRASVRRKRVPGLDHAGQIEVD